MKFTIHVKDQQTKARKGELTLSHGTVQTPVFMPVGTVGSVKGISSEELIAMGAEIILGNTYHLNLRPSSEYIKETFDSLHNFMNWHKPVLTDSGGFQVFSLGLRSEVNGGEGPKLVKMREEGVEFRSHIDGSKHFFTPERVIDIQRNLGSDILMPLDVCTEHPATYERTRETMEQTHRWEKRAIEYWQKIIEDDKERISARFSPMNQGALANGFNTSFSSPSKLGDEEKKVGKQALFGIIQGGIYDDLRKESAQFISGLGFDGIAIGGVSVGEGKEAMQTAVAATIPYIPEDAPRYLMGVGEPVDMIRAIAQGIDMFDCVLPTRLGRHGVAWIGDERVGFTSLNLIRPQFKEDKTVLDQVCSCPACIHGYSRAYIHHLLREKEILGIRLITLHNLHFVLQLFTRIRRSIEAETFAADFSSILQ